MAEFSGLAFNLIKQELQFDAGGFCDFTQGSSAGVKLIAAVAHNIDTAEKLSARAEYIQGESVKDDGKLSSDDPALTQALHQPGNAVLLSLDDKAKVKPNVYAYGKKTACLQTLTMALPALRQSGFQTLSLWRSKSQAEFVEQDHRIANLLLPHVFQAFSIHRQLCVSNPDPSGLVGTAICNLSGVLHFIEQTSLSLLQQDFPDWAPPFLPPKLLSHLRSSSVKIYISKHFTVRKQVKNHFLFLSFQKTSNLEKLSPTELLIAEMLANNDNYKSIAQRLGSQPSTVRNQAHSIYVKFGISGKAELAKVMQLRYGS